MKEPDWSQATPQERHRPPHIVAGDALFVTASTLKRIPHLRSPARKDYLQQLLSRRCQEFQIDLIAWVILDEHYHVVLRPDTQEGFLSWIQALHRDTAREWNREDTAPGRQIWYEYWDTTLWTQGDLWSRINYVHNNPVKHGYVEDARQWSWSSLRELDYWHEPDPVALLSRFPAPRKLPKDDF